MEVDRRVFLATLGAGALEVMTPEDKAEALEHYMMDEFDEPAAPAKPEVSDSQEQDGPRAPRGTGRLFMPREGLYEPMPDKPTAGRFLQPAFRAGPPRAPERVACFEDGPARENGDGLPAARRRR